MNDNDVHKLRRVELLELLVEISKENDRLKAENESLKAQLDDKTIKINNCGSLAEAAVQICGVLEAAQNAADCYLENIRLMHKSDNNGIKDENIKIQRDLSEEEKKD